MQAILIVLRCACCRRQANVGIAMGLAGTDVAKEAANMILLDDNFASIVRGIENGRLSFENLKKVVSYLLPAGSFSEATPIIANVFLGMPLPLSSFLMVRRHCPLSFPPPTIDAAAATSIARLSNPLLLLVSCVRSSSA
jgi:magnesium-transporting ATPase (P-type)